MTKSDTSSPAFFASFLYEMGAVKIDTEKGFKLKLHETNPEAPLSPIYLNLRTPENPKPGPLDKKMMGMMGAMLWQYVKANELKFDAVAGLPNAGTPIAKALAAVAGWSKVQLPIVSLGKIEGIGGRKIEGVLDTGRTKPGATVLIIDDLVTRADSKNEGIDALVSAGFVVNDVLVYLDREQGGKEDLAKRGVNLSSLTTMKELVRQLCSEKKISAQVRDRVLAYLASPQT